MGNGQGKQISKKELFSQLERDQQLIIENWYETLKEENSDRVSFAVFKEDVLKRFGNMPTRLLDALFQCMEPDSASFLSQDAFVYLVYILLYGTEKETIELVYSMIPYLDNTEVVTWRKIRILLEIVGNSSNNGLWTYEHMMSCLQIDPNQGDEYIVSWSQFLDFGLQHPECPLISWVYQFREPIRQACTLRNQLTEATPATTSKLSRKFYATRRNLYYTKIRDVSIAVLMDIYGILSRSADKGLITKTQWISEMSKFFSPDHCTR